MQRMDPYADLDKVASRMVSRNDVIARSLSAIEMDRGRGRMVDGQGRGGDPEGAVRTRGSPAHVC